MRLFHRESAADKAPIPGLAETAAAKGWQPAPDQPFDRELHDALFEMAWDMYGVPRGSVGQEMGRNWRGIGFRDAFRFSDAGRTVTVANARTRLGYNVRFLGPLMDIAVCTIQLPALLAPGCVQGRRYPSLSRLRPTPTGNPAFDERYQAALIPTPNGTWLTPEVQQLVLAHDDWVLLSMGTTLSCVTQGSFTSADDVVRRVSDVLQLVAAIPTSMLPDHADHSVDDLAARVSRIDNIDDALAFLQQLSDADRERLAHSDTPLADFADVRTPEEAMLRMQSLPPARQMQLMAMFMH